MNTRTFARHVGGGFLAGACVNVGADMEMARVYTDNLLNDGGISSGASLGGDFGPGSEF